MDFKHASAMICVDLCPTSLRFSSSLREIGLSVSSLKLPRLGGLVRLGRACPPILSMN
jgi:hypothetical protein